MNVFKKSLLVSTALLLGMQETWSLPLGGEKIQEESEQTTRRHPQVSKKEPPKTEKKFIKNASDLYYGDDDISEYVKSCIQQNDNFSYFNDSEYLLTSNKGGFFPIKDQEDGNEYVVAVTPAINTLGRDQTYDLLSGGCASSTNIGYFLDKSSHPKDGREVVLEELVSFKPVSQEYPYGDLIQKIEDLKRSQLKLEFIHDILEGQEENVNNICTRFREELNKIKEEKKDVFDELMSFFIKPEYSYAKILFPYNQSQIHWLTGEIQIHKEEDCYKVKIYAHDPYGKGEMGETSFKELSVIIQKRIQDFRPAAQFIAIQNLQSPYMQRQAREDQISCGVIAAEGLIKRIVGPLEGLCYPIGALELRRSHLKVVEKNSPELEFINRNKAKIDSINQYKTPLDDPQVTSQKGAEEGLDQFFQEDERRFQEEEIKEEFLEELVNIVCPTVTFLEFLNNSEVLRNLAKPLAQKPDTEALLEDALSLLRDKTALKSLKSDVAKLEKNEYSLRIMLEENLKTIEPGELGIFCKEEGRLYCKTAEQKEILQITESGDPKVGLRPDVFKRILNAVKASQKIESNDEKDLFQYTLLRGYTQTPLVISLGSTQVGKSKLGEWLAGKRLNSRYDRNQSNRCIIKSPQEESHSRVESDTKIPNLLRCKSKNCLIYYIDCPGFGDTEGPLQNIKNSLYLNELITINRPLTILVLEEAEHLWIGPGTHIVKEPFLFLKNTFGTLIEEPNIVSLIITKYPKDPSMNLGQIKTHMKRLAGVQRDQTIKKLLLNFSNGHNTIALFSRPEKEEIFQDTGICKNFEEKNIILDNIKKLESLPLSLIQAARISLCTESELYIKDIICNLENYLTQLLTKSIANPLNDFYRLRKEGLEKKVNILVEEVVEETFTSYNILRGLSNEETFNKYSIPKPGLTEKTLRLSSNTLYRLTEAIAATAIPVSSTLLIAVPVGVGAVGVAMTADYLLKAAEKKGWKSKVTPYIRKKARENLNNEFTQLSNFLRIMETGIVRGYLSNLLEDKNTDSPDKTVASKIETISPAIEYMYAILSSRTGDNNDLYFYNKIWYPVFKDIEPKLRTGIIDQEELLNIPAKKKLIEHVRKEMPHIRESFIDTLLTNYLDESNRDEHINLTGSPLTEERGENMIRYLKLCDEIYTNKFTKFFYKRQHYEDIENILNKIIQDNKTIGKLYNDLASTSKKKSSNLQPASGQEIKARSKHMKIDQIPAPPIDEQLSKLPKDYATSMREINNFLESINRQPIKCKNVEHILTTMNKLSTIRQDLFSQSLCYFEEPKGESIPKNRKYKAPGKEQKEYEISDKAIVEFSFLQRTGLLQNENITVLDVGFRNLNDVEGFFVKGLKKVAKTFKDNPTSRFDEGGEVDFIAYIEEDPTHERDKFFIVYSGSNSDLDWVNNLTVGYQRLADLNLHAGICNLFGEARQTYISGLMVRIKAYYKSHVVPKTLEIITTGHSLGGALALLAAYYYKEQAQDKTSTLVKIFQGNSDNISVKTFTFGAPPIFDEQSKRTVEEKLGKSNIFRVWTYSDLVVWLPTIKYVHTGLSFPLYNIDNHSFGITDKLFFWRMSEHLPNAYDFYLKKLQPPLSYYHHTLTTILNKYLKDTNLYALKSDGDNIQDK